MLAAGAWQTGDVTPRVRAPELAGRGWLNTPVRSGSATCAALRAAGLLDLLLHQLPARPRRAAAAGGEVRRRAGGRRRALAEVRARGRPGRAGAPPSSGTGCTTRCSTTPSCATWQAVHRPGLADAGAWSTPRATSSRSTPARGTRTPSTRCSTSWSPSTRDQGHAAARRTRRTSRREPAASDLRFPAKAIALPDGNLLVADAGHHSLVELAADARRVVRRIGTGERGLADGVADARFTEPNGLCLLPADVAGEVGYDVRRRGHRQPRAARRSTSATGQVAHRRRRRPAVDRRATATGPALGRRPRGTSPGGRTGSWVAMAGIHQLWTFDPRTGHARASSPAPPTRGCVDGPLAEAWFAQPSGLRGRRRPALVRRLGDLRAALRRGRRGRTPPSAPGCSTSVTSTARPTQALLQHPLGVTALPDGSVAVARHLQRRGPPLRPATGAAVHAGTGLAEPSDAVLSRRPPAGGRVGRAPADPASAASATARTADGSRTGRSARSPRSAPGEVALDVVFTRRPGRSWTTGTGRRPGCWSPSTPPELLATARAAAPT